MFFTAGIDIGASASKAVILKSTDFIKVELVGRAVLRSGVNFTLAANQVFDLALAEAKISADRIDCIFACGYGRDNVIFANQTRTEIATHSACVYRYFPYSLTVLDIGGQDNKIIKLDDLGRRINFKMNRKCAAGTGTFLEEMALRLNVNFTDFDMLARSSKSEINLGSYCTVFSASEILTYISKGVAVADLVKGLFRSVIKRIIEIGVLHEIVVMTGGVVAYNSYLVEMLSETLGRPVFTPPWPQLAGAEGAAYLAMQSLNR